MTPVKTGLDILIPRPTPALRHTRVGLICHQASVDSSLRHAVPLLRSQKINLTTLFAPEHGMWGTAQDQIPIPGQKDTALGIPIYSLYGEHRHPSLESLQNVDALICDL